MASFSMVGIALLLAWLLYRHILYPLLFSGHSQIPNAHFASALSPLWLRWHRRGGREGIAFLHSMHQKKGPLLRLSPTEISVASLEGIRKIYISGYGRPESFVKDLVHWKTRNLFTMPSKQEHAERRRQMANVYAKSYIMRSNDMRIMSKVIIFERLLPVLNAAVENGEFDVMRLSRACASDFTSAYLWGLGNGTNFVLDPDNKAAVFFRVQDAFIETGFQHPTREPAEAQGLQFCQAATDQLTRQSREKSAENSTQATTTPVVFSQLHKTLPKSALESHIPETNLSVVLASETFDHLLAGLDGPRTALSFLTWHLSKQPSLQKRLREELLSLNPRLHATASHELPSFHALDSLPLLDAILTETLRLYPAIQSRQPRVTPPEGCTLHGHYIPGGITVSAATYYFNRNESVFPKPTDWNPERWIIKENDKDDEERVKDMRRWLLTFSVGARTCVGKHLAELFMKLVIAALYTNYTTAIVQDEGMVQRDALFSIPVADKLILKLSPAV